MPQQVDNKPAAGGQPSPDEGPAQAERSDNVSPASPQDTAKAPVALQALAQPDVLRDLRKLAKSVDYRLAVPESKQPFFEDLEHRTRQMSLKNMSPEELKQYSGLFLEMVHLLQYPW